MWFDFFCGIGMFIIYVVYVFWNWWIFWILVCFGFFDVIEIFVFCFGMVFVLVFGKIFDNYGWGIGVVWIVY